MRKSTPRAHGWVWKNSFPADPATALKSGRPVPSMRFPPPTVWLLALAGAACSAKGVVAAPTLVLDEAHPTVILATWSDEDCTLDWGVGALDKHASGGAATLLGVPTDTTVTAQVDCAGTLGEAATIQTGELPATVPFLDPFSALDTPLEESYILTSGIGVKDHSVIVMSDLAGGVVWWSDGGVYTLADAHYDPDADCVYAVSWDTKYDADSFLVAPLAGASRSFIVPGIHHDSLAMGGGVYLLMRTEIRTIDDVLIAGDVLTMLDTDTGTTTDVWNAFDELEIVENDGWRLPTPEGAADWTHANGLDRDPATGKLYLSLYFDEAIVEIDPTTWQTGWVLGGPQSDFTVPDPFGPQHSPVFRGDTLWMFDNGSDVSEGSKLAAYDVEVGTMVATRTWTWAPDPAPFEVALGSIAVYDDAKLSSWGNTPEIRIVLPDDQEGAHYGLKGAMSVGYTSFVELH